MCYEIHEALEQSFQTKRLGHQFKQVLLFNDKNDSFLFTATAARFHFLNAISKWAMMDSRTEHFERITNFFYTEPWAEAISSHQLQSFIPFSRDKNT